MLPQITLTGEVRRQRVDHGGLVWPRHRILDRCRQHHPADFRRRARCCTGNCAWRRAAFDEASAQYEATVLSAFQNVADTLEAIKSDADALAAVAKAEAAAKTSLDIAKHQLELGAVNYLTLLNAEQTYEQAVVNRWVQAQASRLADTAALFTRRLAADGGCRPEASRRGPDVATQKPCTAIPQG